jgi:hypothetical protein
MMIYFQKYWKKKKRKKQMMIQKRGRIPPQWLSP